MNRDEREDFDTIVRDIFAPMYPPIAEQIIDKTGVISGKCIDAGCGTGALGRSLARLTDLHITFCDQSDEMLDFAKKYAKEEYIYHRSSFLEGEIQNIEVPRETIDLVISRGLSPFWDDWHQSYSAILRVLKVGGKAYIGGGFSNVELREKIIHTLQEKNLKREQHSEFTIIDDESGFWVYITK